MNEEISCKTCAKSKYHNNRGVLCSEDGCFCSNGFPHFESKEEYPKTATLLEAVEWMEKGNNAESPKGKSCIYIYNNKFYDVYGKHSPLIITPDIIKGEWKLLPPDKPEPEFIYCQKCSMASAKKHDTNYCFHCGNSFKNNTITHDEIRKTLIDTVKNIEIIIDKLEF